MKYDVKIYEYIMAMRIISNYIYAILALQGMIGFDGSGSPQTASREAPIS